MHLLCESLTFPVSFYDAFHVPRLVYIYQSIQSFNSHTSVYGTVCVVHLLYLLYYLTLLLSQDLFDLMIIFSGQEQVRPVMA